MSGPDQVNFDPTKLKDRIFNLLPVEPAKYVTHHILRLKLALLRADLLWLLDSMSTSANPYVSCAQLLQYPKSILFSYLLITFMHI